MTRRVLVDLDAGTDDAVALLLLLTRECKSEYEIVGITCTHGNTTVDNVCRNVMITLEKINRTDVPVFRGAEKGLISVSHPESTRIKYFHGKNGFADKILSSPKASIHSENAVPALNRLAVGGITLICLGPLTNVALALRTYPEFSRNVNEIYIMGGCLTGVGNATPLTEFNFFLDPEAVHIVFSTLTCPITLLPWESCTTGIMTTEERFKLDDARPHMQLLNTIEREQYREKQFWSPCDAMLAAAFLKEEFVKGHQKLHLEIELNTRGQVLVNDQKSPNARVIKETDADIFKELITEMASFTPHFQ